MLQTSEDLVYSSVSKSATNIGLKTRHRIDPKYNIHEQIGFTNTLCTKFISSLTVHTSLSELDIIVHAKHTSDLIFKELGQTVAGSPRLKKKQGFILTMQTPD